MSSRAKHSTWQVVAGLIAITIVFGLAVLMVLERYDPSVITTVITGTSLASAELVRRLQAFTSAPSEPDHPPKEGS